MPADEPAVLLLHGALGAAASMRPLAERLAPRLAVHTLDFAGHGAAPPPAVPLTIDVLADQVASYIEARSLAPARVFGYSLGGYVALHLAVTRPALVERVQTLATKLAWSPDVSANMARQFDAATIRAKVPRLADALAAMHGAERWEPLLASTRAMLDDLGGHPRLTVATCASLARPVRLCVGDHDTTVTIEETITAMRAIPGAELEVLPATPHLLERMNLERVAASAIDFLGAAA